MGESPRNKKKAPERVGETSKTKKKKKKEEKCCDDPSPIKSKKTGKRKCKNCGTKLKPKKEEPSATYKAIGQLLNDVKDGEMILWHEGERPFCTIRIDNHSEHYKLRSVIVEGWLRRRHKKQRGAILNRQVLNALLDEAEGWAMLGPELETHVRLAEHDGHIYLDLADKRRRVVEISANEWKIIDGANCPIRFRRTTGVLALSEPVRNGSVEDLRKVLNIEDRDWDLLLLWMVCALRPGRSTPILVVQGEHGAAKSWLCKIIRSIIDPNKVPERSTPKEERDLAIAANNALVLSFGNLSRIPEWLSDALCRVATGGGLATRKLYSDDEEALFDFLRPVIVNGITNIASRPDFADRSLVLRLPAILDEHRRTERDLDFALKHIQPRVLGALLDAVACGLHRIADIENENYILPRLADAATWSMACAPALGLEPNHTLALLLEARKDATTSSVADDPVLNAILFFAKENDTWTGTSTKLLELLEAKVPVDRRSRGSEWPKSTKGLTMMLDRLIPTLRELGVDVDRWKEHGVHSRRLINIRRIDNQGTLEFDLDASNDAGASQQSDDDLQREIRENAVIQLRPKTS